MLLGAVPHEYAASAWIKRKSAWNVGCVPPEGAARALGCQRHVEDTRLDRIRQQAHLSGGPAGGQVLGRAARRWRFFRGTSARLALNVVRSSCPSQAERSIQLQREQYSIPSDGVRTSCDCCCCGGSHRRWPSVRKGVFVGLRMKSAWLLFRLHHRHWRHDSGRPAAKGTRPSPSNHVERRCSLGDIDPARCL